PLKPVQNSALQNRFLNGFQIALRRKPEAGSTSPRRMLRRQLMTPSFSLQGYVLATQTQATDEGAVTTGVLTLQVVQQLAALVDHADQATTRVVVLAVGLEVVLQLVDVGGQQGNLHFRRTGIAFSLLVVVNDLGFFFNAQCHDGLLE